MAEPSGPVDGQNRVVEGLVTTGGVAGLKKGGNAAAVTGSAYQALDTIVGGAGAAGTPAPDVITVQGIASGTPMQDNITQVGGAAIALGQAAMTSSLPVAIANNQSAIPANVTQVGGVSVGSNGAVAPTYPLAVAGSDGTLLHTLRTATNGDVIVEGLGTSGTPVGGILTVQGPNTDGNLGIGRETNGSGYDTVGWASPTTFQNNALSVAPMVYNPATLGWDRLRTPSTFKTIAAVAVVAGTPVAIWTPTAGKKFRFLGFHLSLTVAGSVILKDAGTEMIRTPLMGAGIGQSSPPMGNGILSAAVNNALNIDVTASGSVSGFVFGTEE